MKNSNDRKYSQFSSLKEIRAEKEYLCKKINRQEKKLAKDWSRIEDSWKIVHKIMSMAGNLISSASVLGGMEIGYKLLSHFFSKKKKQKKFTSV